MPRPIAPENAPEPLRPPLLPGDGVPWFRAPSDINDDFQFSSLGGRRVVLALLGSFRAEATRPLFDALMARADAFSTPDRALILLSLDPADRAAKLPKHLSGVRFLFDPEGLVSAAFGACDAAEPGRYRPLVFVLDERLRVASVHGLERGTADAALAGLDALGPLPPPAPAAVQAPVLIVPHVFEPAFCRRLIDGYATHGGHDSGYMKERDGKTVMVLDHNHKRRMDWIIEDAALMGEIRLRILRRLVPEIQKAYQFKVTRMERYLVACYEAATGGHFNAHRDNTTKGTAHRRFAVSINLNAEDYTGGDLVFPEYGTARHRPPTGGACVFSCSLLHEATPVTAGDRFVFLPFVYDDAAALIRDENKAFVA